MCGIVGYVGHRPAAPLLIEALKRLEYRGYDSAGVALLGDSALTVVRCPGRVSVLEAEMAAIDGSNSAIGIAHTRWATHGAPSQKNAHPHTAITRGDHKVAVVHNGIIENHEVLRTYLEERGRTFTSETDSEVIAQLIAELYEEDLESAVQAALRRIQGAYAIGVLCEADPTTLICARKGSPLLVGIGDHSYVVASDPSAIIAHTAQVIALDDDQVVRLTGDMPFAAGGAPAPIALSTTTIDNVPVSSEIRELDMDLEQIELGAYDHFMLKEIMEQPDALRNCLRGRIDDRESRIVLGGLSGYVKELVQASRFVLTAQGTAYHAAMIGRYLIEDLAKMPAHCEYASEFRYRNPIIEDRSVLVAISQSGETADTLAAMREASDRGATVIGVVNTAGSTISRETDAGVYLHMGPEIGVASTKAFLGQVAVLTLLSLFIGRRRFLSHEALQTYLDELRRMPERIDGVLAQSDHIRECANRFIDRENWLFLGRGYNYPVALEGALKLKEISYIHAEGMPAAEIKHGPIALIDEAMPVVVIATRGSQYEKALANIAEVRARGGRVLAVATEGDDQIVRHAEAVFSVPDVPEALQPLLTAVPLQLLSYHAAVLRGHDVDKPRNLAKSVTVE